MGEGTAPGCWDRSADAGVAAAAAADPGSAGAKFAGSDVAILTLRATRTRRPARSISISVRLVSSSSSASSRMSALSSFENFAAALSSGWRAMVKFRKRVNPKTRGRGWRTGASGLCLDADPGGKARYRKPVAVNTEAGKRCESGHRGEGVMTETLARVNVAHMHLDGRDFHRDQCIVQRNRGVRIAAGIDDDPCGLVGMRLVDEIDQLAFAVGLPAIGLEAELRGRLGAKLLDIGELGMAIGLGLARSQQIEVRAVEHVNRIGSCSGHPNPGNAVSSGVS